MLDYVPKALTHFQHTPPRIPQHQLYPHGKPTYRAKAQYTENVDTSPPLDKKGKKYIQEVIGTFLYYARCVDSTMLLLDILYLTTQEYGEKCILEVDPKSQLPYIWKCYEFIVYMNSYCK